MRPSAKLTPNIVSLPCMVVLTYFVEVAYCESMIRSPLRSSPYLKWNTLASMKGLSRLVSRLRGSGSVPLKRIRE